MAVEARVQAESEAEAEVPPCSATRREEQPRLAVRVPASEAAQFTTHAHMRQGGPCNDSKSYTEVYSCGEGCACRHMSFKYLSKQTFMRRELVKWRGLLTDFGAR